VEEGRELGEELVEGAHGRRADQGGVTPVEDEDQVLHDVCQEEEADQDVGHGRGPSAINERCDIKDISDNGESH